MTAFLESLTIVFSPVSLIFMVIATAFGIICGALPGLGPSMAIILLLPFTYGMDPIVGIIVLVAVNVGAQAGGSISAILLRVPGTSSAIATTFDGYPMALKGKAGRARGACHDCICIWKHIFSYCNAGLGASFGKVRT